MSHHRPFSPRPRRDGFDRLLDTATTPRVPADLAARIAREVPRLAQVAPLAGDPIGTAGKSAKLAANPAANPAPPLRRRAARGWVLAAGMGALAAGVASIIIGTPASVSPPSLPPAAPLATHELAPPAVSPQAASAPATPAVIRMADAPVMAPVPAPAARIARTPARAAGQGALPPAKPLAPGTSQPEALAAIAPPPPAGATDPAGAPTMLPRGQMGPVLPQGYGYSGGGGSGGGIPSGAPVKMSGGPSGN
jgi:hypothetical protein